MFRSVLLLLAVICAVYAQVTFKNLAGEPSEFASNLLPVPQQNAQTQSSSNQLIELAATSKKNVVSAEVSIVVDSNTLFSFSFFSPHDDVLDLELVDPKGKKVKHLSKYAKAGNFPIGDFGVDGTTYTFDHPVVGTYTLTITSETLKKKVYESILSNTVPDAYIVVFNENTVQEHTYINTYSLFTGSQVGVVTRAFNDTISVADIQSGKTPKPLNSIQSANMLVLFPDGTVVQETMQDDGLNADEAANDGIYGAMITATEPGDYIIQAVIEGVAPNGETFLRTTEQVVSVIDQTATMTEDYAIGSIDTGSNRMNVSFVLDSTSAIAKYRAYAEVWGVNANGTAVAICWIGGMSMAVQNADGSIVLPLELDLNWVSRVGAQAPFTLKNVIVQEPNTFIPLIQASSVTLKTTFNFEQVMSSLHPTLIHDTVAEITEEMRMGRRPAHIMNMNATSASLLLTHGYCSEVNPFETVADDFTDALFFLNAKASLGNDGFALAVMEYAGNQPFAYVGHSQGGMVGLHIFNYYWTGIDNVSGGRLIQTVGTPYMGCGAAGTAAGLGKVFGVGCGTNTDLTKDGAVLWLSGIAQATRAKAYYWTTTYKQGNLFGDNCNLAMNLVLSWPNDGVAEFDYAQLEGANNMGNKQQWCHSVGMKYTAQTQDPDRNKEMNDSAARNL